MNEKFLVLSDCSEQFTFLLETWIVLSCVAMHVANGPQKMLIPLNGLFWCQIMPKRVFLSAATNLQIAKWTLRTAKILRIFFPLTFFPPPHFDFCFCLHHHLPPPLETLLLLPLQTSPEAPLTPKRRKKRTFFKKAWRRLRDFCGVEWQVPPPDENAKKSRALLKGETRQFRENAWCFLTLIKCETSTLLVLYNCRVQS